MLMVLTDLNMPVMTGIQLTEKIRRLYPAAEQPIIMVTTHKESQDNEAALRAGASALLHKPFNAMSLGAAMDKMVSAVGG